MTKVCIASDHHGIAVKSKIIEYLTKKKYEVIDYGPNDSEAVDYPIYAKKVGYAIAKKEADFGILICATGIGMSMACNRIKGVRCARVTDVDDTIHTRQDNDANVIAFSSNLRKYKIYDILDAFLTTEFSNEERHKRRIDMIDEDYYD